MNIYILALSMGKPEFLQPLNKKSVKF
jgi:hypothetical protein